MLLSQHTGGDRTAGLQVIQHSSAPDDVDALLSAMWKGWSHEQKGRAGLERSGAVGTGGGAEQQPMCCAGGAGRAFPRQADSSAALLQRAASFLKVVIGKCHYSLSRVPVMQELSLHLSPLSTK